MHAHSCTHPHRNPLPALSVATQICNAPGPATSVAACSPFNQHHQTHATNINATRNEKTPGRELRGPCRALPGAGRSAGGGARPVHLHRGHALLVERPSGGVAVPVGAGRRRRQGSSSSSSVDSWTRDGRGSGPGFRRARLGDGAGDEASGTKPPRSRRWPVRVMGAR